MSGDRMLRAFKLLAAFSLTPVLIVYIGTAIFALVSHIGDKFAPSTIGEWIEFMHLEAIWVTIFVSPFVALASVLILLPSYLQIKKHR